MTPRTPLFAILFVLSGSVALSHCGSDERVAPGDGAPDAGALEQRDLRALVFSRTAGFRHPSIDDAKAFFGGLDAESQRLTVTMTEDSGVFTDAGLAPFDVVAFVNTTGDVLDEAQQAALQGFVRAGRGFVGVHSAADTEHDWPWYGELVGAYFVSHPLLPLEATLTREDRDHPSTAHFDATFPFNDEWYNFDRNPRNDHEILLTVDETAFYQPSGDPLPTFPPNSPFMGADHPVAWAKEFEGGRSFYTNLGHRPESWSDERFRAHLLAGIRWASGPAQFSRIVLTTKASNPLALRVTPDGRVLYIERTGEVSAWNPKTGRVTTALALPVDTSAENGLLGIALDPGFAKNRYVYLYHSAPQQDPPQIPPGRNVLSRFVLGQDDTLDPATRIVIFEVPSERSCCHEGGQLEFLPDGTLLVGVGDNTNPHESAGAAPLDERPGRESFDARRTAGNPDDLRGKILRIRTDGSAPGGNLFSESGAGRPEIYAMGVRNPFRIAVDPQNGRIYWGDIGPDGSEDGARGPRGYDEIDYTDTPGDFGWPYCIAENIPYARYDFATDIAGELFSCEGKRPALMAYDYSTVGYLALGSATNSESKSGVVGAFTGRAALAGVVYRAPQGAPFAFPSSLAGKLIMADWTRDILAAVTVDASGLLGGLRRIVPFYDFRRPIDLEVGPDGALYVLEYGSQYGGDNIDAKVVRIEHSAIGALSPVARASASPAAGSGPLTVTLSASGSTAPGFRDSIVGYEWDFDGDRSVDATAETVEHTFAQSGLHQPSLVIVGSSGRRSLPAVAEIVVGNTPPEVAITAPADGSSYREGDSVTLTAEVTDAEDGTIDCLDVKWDVRLGHNAHSHPAFTLSGCTATFSAGLGGHSSVEAGLFYAVELVYTDRGGPAGEPPLTDRALITLFVSAAEP